MVPVAEEVAVAVVVAVAAAAAAADVDARSIPKTSAMNVASEVIMPETVPDTTNAAVAAEEGKISNQMPHVQMFFVEFHFLLISNFFMVSTRGILHSVFSISHFLSLSF